MQKKNNTAVILIAFLPDPRFEKRIALGKEIFDLHVICWDRGVDMLAPPKEDGYKLHMLKIDARNDPLKRMYPYLKFCRAAKILLKELQPQLIDVQGLDMLKIAMDYKKKHPDTRVIYEIADLHPLLIDKQKNPIRFIAQKYLRKLDIELCKKIDLLIVTSEKYWEVYFSKFVDEKKAMVFPNVPNLRAFESYQKKKHTAPLTVGAIGGVRFKKQIKNLLRAAQDCNVNVMFAGFESGGNEIEKLCEKMPNVEWLGRYDYNSQIAEIYGKCDLVYSVYDTSIANISVALPNKLYESIYCEIPILVAKNTYLSQLVEKWGVGIAVDSEDVEDLKKVLCRFRDNPDLLIPYEKNCKEHKNICEIEYYNNRLKDFFREKGLME